MHDPLPQKTTRDLGALLVYFACLAWRYAKAFLNHIGPFVRPPNDMHVTTRDGGQFTGIVVIEKNGVTDGVVMRVGQDGSRYNPPGHERPWSSPEPDHEPSRDQGSALNHWASDPRDERDEPWRR